MKCAFKNSWLFCEGIQIYQINQYTVSLPPSLLSLSAIVVVVVVVVIVVVVAVVAVVAVVVVVVAVQLSSKPLKNDFQIKCQIKRHRTSQNKIRYVFFKK